MVEGGGRSFEYTPTWIVALVCLIIVFISLGAERALHHLGKCFLRHGQDALNEALQKVKEELMLLGFISLLLTVFQGLVSDICIPAKLANIMLPCKLPQTGSSTGSHLLVNNGRRLLAEGAREHLCGRGKVPFLSLEALHQLHIFIFVLAVVYVIFCATTMFLGVAKVREWKHWERSIREESSTRHHGHHLGHQLKEFMGRAGRYWRKFHVVSWMVAFFKQFYGSVTKSDYIALRSGFIQEHCPNNPTFDFHKYMLRTLEDDFKKIIGISWFLWLFVVVFLLMNIAGWHTYFWLSFLPLVLLLIVGAKLEHIITQLAKDAAERTSASGDAEHAVVKPSDELFWFQRPIIVLYLIHFILFQNSFEVAFFFWIVCTYGFKSCIIEQLGFIIPRLVIGIIVQVLCSYSTLPLYAIVTQMGSMFKKTIFEEFMQALIIDWFKGTKSGMPKARRTQTNKLAIELAQGSSSLVEQSLAREISASTMEFPSLNRSHMPSSSV